MPTYRVVVRGEGLVVRRWLLFRQTLGFFATRLVIAPSCEAAGEIALSQIRGEPRLPLAALRAPTLAVEDVAPADADTATGPQPGIVFFPGARDRPSAKPAT